MIVFWIACVANFHRDELLVGAPAVLASAGFSFYALGKLSLRFRPSLRDLAEIWRLPWSVVVDLALVLRVLALDLAGSRAPSLFRAVRWRANSYDPQDVARRALAVAYTTVSPNCVVVGIDRKRQRMLFHQLKRSPLSEMTRRFGAGSGR